MRRIQLFFITILAATSLSAQEVWPGDVNDNGVVNAVDLLYWGVAFGAEGPARAVTNSDWSAQPFPTPWAQSFDNGLNYAYADCNGDGVVNQDDFDDAIDENFGEENPPIGFEGYANASGNAPKLKLTPSQVLVEEGAMVSVALSIDNSQVALDSFYGMALQLSYTTGLLEGDDGPDFDLEEDSWLESDESYVQELFVDDDGMGTAQLGITRTNQQSITAQSGVIGQFELIVEDIIVGLEVDTFYLTIDSVFLSNDRMTAIPVIPDTTFIVIAKDTTKLTTNWKEIDLTEQATMIQVYPNPATDVVFVRSPIPVRQLRLVSSNGNVWQEQSSIAPSLVSELSVAGLPAGVYWLQVFTEGGVLHKRIVITGS